MPSYDRIKHGVICKYYINNTCKYGKKCLLYHPKPNQLKSPRVQKEIKRKSGCCYCGSYLRIVLNRNKILEKDSRFFMVCAKSGRSMKKCM